MKRYSYGKVITLLVLAAAVFWGGCEALGRRSTQRAGKQDKLFDYRQITLNNGLRVITLEDFSSPIVAVDLWYHVGSKDENPERQGFAHMFEHMMFKGTDVVDERDHFALIQRVGGTNNAYTSFDKTVYIQTLPADQLELALWLEAERMAFLRIDQDAFDTERQVVEEELRMGENRPYGTLFKKVFAEIFAGTPYEWTPIGKLADLRAASVPELRDFWTKYYVPNNATLVIVGAVEHAEAQRLAERYFGWIPKGPAKEDAKVSAKQASSPRRLVVDDENAPAGVVRAAWRTVPSGHPDEAALDLLAEILGGGNSSRLYRDLVAERQLSVQASSSTFNLELDGIFEASAMQETGRDNAAEILESMRGHIRRLQQESVSEKELEKARNQRLKAVITENLTVESKASILGHAAVIQKDVSQANRILDEIRGVSREDIRRVASEYLAEDREIVIIVKENDKGAMAGAKDSEDAPITGKPETDPPLPGRRGVARPTNWPSEPPLADMQQYAIGEDYTRTRLENGLQVIVIPNDEVPFVSVSLGLTNGAWTEGKPGTASMALQMLTKGTARHTEGELAAELEQYAISLTGLAGMDTSTVAANCMAEHVERAASLLAEVVLAPTFDAAEFEKLKKQVVTGLAIEQQSPGYMAERELRRQLYGMHPYARTVSGEVADVAALTSDDLALWWSKFARPDQATLIFAGDITRDRALELARRFLGGWKTGLVEMGLVLPDLPPAQSMRITIVDRPGSMQSEIRVGQVGITRRTQPAYFVSRIVSLYFGGSFNSWLNRAIRVERGLTYGAQGGYHAQNMKGEFRVSTFTRNESTAQAVQVIIDQIRRLRTEPPDSGDLEDAKTYFAGSFVRQRETPQAIAEDLWLVESQRLGSDYFERLMASIAETTSAHCVELAAASLDPGNLVIVVVGDAEKIKADLEAIAPVTVIKVP